MILGCSHTPNCITVLQKWSDYPKAIYQGKMGRGAGKHTKNKGKPLASHPLFTFLRGVKGNARGCIVTEPLWGIPFFLYAPYVSVYMLAIGLDDSQVGLIASIGLAFQALSALLSGAITDKLGRKRATFVFDLISWSIPCLIWAVAQNFTYFLIAAVINSLWRVTHNSWSCLLVEDTDQDTLLDVYTWIYIAGLLAAFFAPLASILINRYTLVPTVRVLYIFAFLMMTAKFLIMNGMVTETKHGLLRMEQTRHQSLFSILSEYRGVFRQVLGSPTTVYTLGVMLVMSTCWMINSTFWSIYVTENLSIPPEHLALYPFARSITMLFFFFLVMPRIRSLDFRNPMLLGLAGFILSQLILIASPVKGYLPLLLSTLIEAVSYATVSTLLDKMVVVTVEPKERARILAILYVIVILFTTPFGWIAGRLSEVNRILPFVLNIVFFAIGGGLILAASSSSARSKGNENLA
jgi:DHA1 family tetracycline resistance protein-like MFS transporter